MFESIEAGVSVTKLSTIFRMSVTTVRRKVANVSPMGFRGTTPIYDLYDVAPYLVKPKFDIEEYIRNLRPTELPASLQKDFWNAQRARQQFEEQAGQLWNTKKVTDVLLQTFKMVREQIVLFSDNASRETGLTTEQRKLIDKMTDSLLDSLHKSVTEHFKEYNSAGDRDGLLENGMPEDTIEPDDTDEEAEIDAFD